jgi:hypothetical protein
MDEVYVNQERKAHLETEILMPDYECVGKGNRFEVLAEITNTGEAVAQNVGATLYTDYFSIIGSATVHSGRDLSQGESVLISWWVEADSDTYCDEMLYVEPLGVDENAHESIPSRNRDWDTAPLQQVPLEMEIYQYPQGPVHTSDTFGISAVITNTAQSQYCAGKCDVCGVTAILHWEGPASLVANESKEKVIGSVAMGTTSHAEWTVHCDKEGDVEFWVELVVDCPDHCSNVVSIFDKDYLDWLYRGGDRVTVEQLPRLIKYTVPLAKDWNVMSLPIIPKYTDIEDVLYHVMPNVDEVWTCYDGCDEVADWHVYWPGHIEDDLTQMVDGKGYFIQMTHFDTVIGEGYSYCDMPGAAMTPPEYMLDWKWNLVGFTTCDFDGDGVITQAGDGMMVGHYLSNLDQVPFNDVIVGEEASFFRYFEPGAGWMALGDGDNMWVGKGFWLYASMSDLSIVPPITQ